MTEIVPGLILHLDELFGAFRDQHALPTSVSKLGESKPSLHSVFKIYLKLLGILLRGH